MVSYILTNVFSLFVGILEKNSTIKNHTKQGYAVTKLPDDVQSELMNYWYTNIHNKLQRERYPEGFIGSNHWSAPAFILPVESYLIDKVQHSIQQSLETWAGGGIHNILPDVYSPTSGVHIHTKGFDYSTSNCRIALFIIYGNCNDRRRCQ